MQSSVASRRASNPFASRFIDPGARPFLYPAGNSAQVLLDRLKANRWRGQIVGPHGSGKSSLLVDLLETCRHRGRPAHLVRLRQGQRRLPPQTWGRPWPSDLLLAIDGFEQLRLTERWRLRWRVARSGCGLLITSHRRRRGLPLLFACRPDVEVLDRIVRQMTGGRGGEFDRERLHRVFDVCEGNLRECLFRLYDEYAASNRISD